MSICTMCTKNICAPFNIKYINFIIIKFTAKKLYLDEYLGNMNAKKLYQDNNFKYNSASIELNLKLYLSPVCK